MTNQAMDQLGSPDQRPIDQLGEYASLDNDLRSDLSSSLNEMSQSVSRDQDQEAFRQAASNAGSVSGSAGWGPYAASLAGSFSNASEEARQSFRDVLRRHGMSGTWAGTRYIPRTLDVYSKETMDSQWAQGVRIEYALTTGATAEFPIVLTQQSWLHSGREPHEEPEVLRMLEERLDQKIEAFSTELADLADRLTTIKGATTQFQADLAATQTDLAATQTGLISQEWQASKLITLEGGRSWGEWEGESKCPLNHYVCSLEQRVEDIQGGDEDDTAMNNLRLRCCPLPGVSLIEGTAQ